MFILYSLTVCTINTDIMMYSMYTAYKLVSSNLSNEDIIMLFDVCLKMLYTTQTFDPVGQMSGVGLVCGLDPW